MMIFPVVKHSEEVQISSESLDCSLCCERLNEAARCPRLLTCGHSFCSACIVSLPQEVCPNCRKSFNYPSSGVGALPKNFALLDVIRTETKRTEQQGASQRCVLCEDPHPAVAACVECAEDMCAIMAEAHSRMKATQDHLVLYFDDPMAHPARAVEVTAASAPVAGGAASQLGQLAAVQCCGRTNKGARCEITSDSVYSQHRKFAVAAGHLARGSRLCGLHRDQKIDKIPPLPFGNPGSNEITFSGGAPTQAFSSNPRAPAAFGSTTQAPGITFGGGAPTQARPSNPLAPAAFGAASQTPGITFGGGAPTQAFYSNPRAQAAFGAASQAPGITFGGGAPTQALPSNPRAPAAFGGASQSPGITFGGSAPTRAFSSNPRAPAAFGAASQAPGISFGGGAPTQALPSNPRAPAAFGGASQTPGITFGGGAPTQAFSWNPRAQAAFGAASQASRISFGSGAPTQAFSWSALAPSVNLPGGGFSLGTLTKNTK